MNHFIKAVTHWLSATGKQSISFLKLVLIIVAFVGFSGQAAAITAYDQFLEKANSGDLAAINMLGNMLKTGTGGAQKDVQASKKWFENAANKGYPPSAFNLGLMFENGADGIEKDLSLARKYYQQSSDAGFQRATERLSTLGNSSQQQAVSNTSSQSGGQRVSSGSTFSGPNGIIWRRCALGKVWDERNKECIGNAVKAPWLDMVDFASKDNFGGFNDWRLPTESEITGLVGNSKGVSCRDLLPRVENFFTSSYSDNPVIYKADHWLLNNSDDLKNPMSMNLRVEAGFACRFMSNDLRAHAPQPAILIRGGVIPEGWKVAISKTPQAQALFNQSKKEGVANLVAENAYMNKVVEQVKDVLSTPPSAATTSSSNSMVEWTITSEENGGGLAHWYTKKYNAKCTSGRKSGERITIHLLKSSGKYQEVSGSAKNSLAEAARDACS